ncbi:two-component system sensor histidine kinase NtrB [Oleidesulfovibrio sp.]|uniref:two-component system sensor histidine kinase NtrB n=1 Tax=Oleidesulfovibrio sp. TaxID=2909707 RepID=UPI003A858E3C
MSPLSRMRFRNKLNLGITLIVLAVSVVLAVVSIQISTSELLAESRRRGMVLASNLALRVTDPMLSVDLLRLKNMVDELVTVDEDVSYAFVLDENSKVLVHTFEEGFPVELRTANLLPHGATKRIRLVDTGLERIYDFAVAVRIGQEHLGTVRMGLSRTRAQKVVQRLVSTISTLTVVSLLLAVLASTHFARRITHRLGMLREYAEQIVRGNMDITVGAYSGPFCWQLTQCGCEDCPAHGDTARRCWHVANTRCREHGLAHDMAASCGDCPVHGRLAGDELQDLAETFDVMAHSLRQHMAELSAAEQDLSRQQKLLRTIIESTPDLVSLVGRDGVYLAANKAFGYWVGHPAESIPGKTDMDIFSPELAQQRMQEHELILSSRSGISREARLKGKTDGKEGWFHVVKVPVTDEAGNVAGILSTARNITEIRSYQDQLIHSQKMESVGNLAGGVAHEINTPLGIILGYAQLLQEDLPEGSQAHEDLKTIERQAKFCRKIVADLLGFSRHTQSEKKEMCFNNSIMEVVQLVRHAFSLESVRIVTILDDRLPIIYGDPAKLKQVWMNLLSNAMQANEGGGVVVVRTMLDIDNLTVSALFADTGVGISEGNMASVFDPFFSTKPVGKGTGLGLSVSFGIIHDHGGDITVNSPLPEGIIPAEELGDREHGPGTMFTVSLPLEPPDWLLDDEDGEDALPQSGSAEGQAGNT